MHRDPRGLVPFWRCTNPDCGKLHGESVTECDACGAKTLPLALCRTCGWDFFMAHSGGHTLEGQPTIVPWERRVSTDETIFLYDGPRTSRNWVTKRTRMNSRARKQRGRDRRRPRRCPSAPGVVEVADGG